MFNSPTVKSARRKQALFILIALVLVLGGGYYCWKGIQHSGGTLGELLWSKRSIALRWTVEFEGELKGLSPDETTLKVGEEEITLPLDSQATFFEQKSVKVEGVPGAWDIESQPLSADDFASQIGKKTRVLLRLMDNDLKGIQVTVISL